MNYIKKKNLTRLGTALATITCLLISPSSWSLNGKRQNDLFFLDAKELKHSSHTYRANANKLFSKIALGSSAKLVDNNRVRNQKISFLGLKNIVFQYKKGKENSSFCRLKFEEIIGKKFLVPSFRYSWTKNGQAEQTVLYLQNLYQGKTGSWSMNLIDLHRDTQHVDLRQWKCLDIGAHHFHRSEELDITVVVISKNSSDSQASAHSSFDKTHVDLTGSLENALSSLFTKLRQ